LRTSCRSAPRSRRRAQLQRRATAAEIAAIGCLLRLVGRPGGRSRAGENGHAPPIPWVVNCSAEGVRSASTLLVTRDFATRSQYFPIRLVAIGAGGGCPELTCVYLLGAGTPRSGGRRPGAALQRDLREDA